MKEEKDIRSTYIQIQGWMVQDLKLKGNELLIFGSIHGFCQDGESEFRGSISYLCTWLNASRPTVSTALQNLCKKGFLIKRVHIVNNVTFNRYKIPLHIVKNIYGGSKDSLQGGSKDSLQGGSKDSLHNKDILDKDILDNIEDNNIVNFQKSENFTQDENGINLDEKKEKAPQNLGAGFEKKEWKAGHGDGELHAKLSEYYKNPNSVKYSPEIYIEFKEYWTALVENGKGKGKEYWRTKDTFLISGRLATWSRNNFNGVKSKTQNNGTNTNPRHKDNWNAEEVARDAIALAQAHLR